MLKHFLIMTLCAVFTLPQTAKADMVHSAAIRYAEYLQARISASNLDAFTPYISAEMLAARAEYVDSFAAKKGISTAEVEQRLIERTKYAESCVGARDFKGGQAVGGDKVILKYSFKDKCAGANAIAANIEEVTMIHENNMWKVGNVTAYPEKPVKIKKVMPLE